MTDRPILFSAPMVRALLAGTKTQTRRIVKPQPVFNTWYGGWTWTTVRGVAKWTTDRPSACALHHGMIPQCPYGQTGDRLWVRETWAVRGLAWGMKPSQAAKIASPDAWRYAADDATGWQHGWKPSIHMPRAASRITLEITGVRVERLQEISEADAKAEGLKQYGHGWEITLATAPKGERICCTVSDPRVAHKALWESINGPGSWAANPWVWVVEFKRCNP